MDRRGVLRLAGAATAGALSGCTSGDAETALDATPENRVSTQKAIPLGLRGEHPGWAEAATGRAVVID